MNYIHEAIVPVCIAAVIVGVVYILASIGITSSNNQLKKSPEQICAEQHITSQTTYCMNLRAK